MLSLVHGFASITHRGNQIVSGVAINFIAAGSTIILGQAWFNQGGRTPSLPPEARFGSIELPGAAALRDVPVIGQLYSGLLSGHSLLAYVAFLAVPFTWWVLFRTRFGLRLRAVGENPAAVDTAGISVAWLRYRAVICTGVLTGVAGCYMALSQNAGFVKDMTAGRGYIALAALIFAKWKPVPAMFACLFFGFLDALSIRLQGTPLPLIGRVPVQLMQALPYILTVILLAGFIGKAIPAARRRRALCERTIVMAHDLFLAAQAAMAKAYAPYSKFPVGAAIRTDDGKIYAGANIEVASYPEGWCAETTALGHYIMGGGGKIAEIAVVAERMARVTPCGGCRQRLAEFAAPETKLFLCDETGIVETTTMGQMLPYGFAGDILK